MKHATSPMLRQAATRGFTLLELLIVVAILGLVTTLFSVSYKTVASRPPIEKFSVELLANLRSVRERAIESQRGQDLRVNLNRRQYEFEFPVRLVRIPGQISLRVTSVRRLSVPGWDAVIRFYPDGSSSGGEIVVQEGNVVKTIEIDWLTGAAGFVR